MLGIEETLDALPGAPDEGLHSTAETPTEEVRVGARGSAQRPNVSKHTLHTEIDTGAMGTPPHSVQTSVPSTPACPPGGSSFPALSI